VHEERRRTCWFHLLDQRDHAARNDQSEGMVIS
jgi:hypothetical protein